MTEVERIAKGLTKAEKSAVLGKIRFLNIEKAFQWPLCGCVERMPDVGSKWQATKLGLAVRDHLMKEVK